MVGEGRPLAYRRSSVIRNMFQSSLVSLKPRCKRYSINDYRRQAMAFTEVGVDSEYSGGYSHLPSSDFVVILKPRHHPPTIHSINHKHSHKPTPSKMSTETTSASGKFAPKTPVQLNPPKDDPISLEQLSKCDGMPLNSLIAIYTRFQKYTRFARAFLLLN